MAELFNKILIANRGECAVRIIKACKELGISTVAVYSQADANSPHVKKADEAVCIGPPPAKKSYLNEYNILAAAKLKEAEAIHPGWGFLAEKALFVNMCQECGVVFIGPSIGTMEQMSNKIQAKQTMIFAGIPVVPGSDGVVKNETEAIEAAKAIGYPVILKAVAGGGGRGIRIISNNQELKDSFLLAQSEAEVAFGDSAIYIEKYFENARHIEFQILADNYENIVHLGERDCSVQRRYQKLIEESPAQITKKLRKKMGEVAIEAVAAVNYTNAGTIEFLVTEDNKYYFMEINKRVQVEHPVTEVRTGIDIVKQQIKIAAGEPLDFRQEDIKFSGHAIEFRINAEDPDKKFLPSGGKITGFSPPEDLKIRVDSHLYPGYEIPPFYDSMLAKLIVWGKTRKKALSKAKKALEKFVIDGIDDRGENIKTTIPFHLKTLENSSFKKGKVSTNFVSEMG